MNERVYVKPAPGAKVLHPQTSMPIPESGAEVPYCTHIARRVREGSLIIVDRQAEAVAAKKETTTDKGKGAK